VNQEALVPRLAMSAAIGGFPILFLIQDIPLTLNEYPEKAIN